MKLFEAPQGSVKIKIKVNFFSLSNIRMGSLINIVIWDCTSNINVINIGTININRYYKYSTINIGSNVYIRTLCFIVLK